MAAFQPNACDVISENLSPTFLESLRNRMRRNNQSQKTFYVYKGPDNYEPLVLYADTTAAQLEGFGSSSGGARNSPTNQSLELNDQSDDDYEDIPLDPPSGNHLHGKVLWEDSRIKFESEVCLGI